MCWYAHRAHHTPNVPLSCSCMRSGDLIPCGIITFRFRRAGGSTRSAFSALFLHVGADILVKEIEGFTDAMHPTVPIKKAFNSNHNATQRNAPNKTCTAVMDESLRTA